MPAVVDVATGFDTVTSTVVPPTPAGAVTVICVAEFTTRPVAAVLPNDTVVAPRRFVPVMTTVLPPADGPFTGESAVTVGVSK